MTGTFADVAASGPLVAAVTVAALAGLISFISPCVLPLIPGYVSFVTGLAGDERSKSRVLLGCLGFISGFTLVFVMLNIAFSATGRFLAGNSRTIEIVMGIAIIVLGLGYLGVIPIMQRVARIGRLPSPGILASPLLGMTFALSWSPCVTPTLGAVLGLAMTQETSGRAAVLGVAYCAGLGIPFLAVGLGMERALTLVRVVRQRNNWVVRIGAALLIGVGIALATGAWADFIIWLKVAASGVEVGI